jgi:hypothetical protein
MNKQVIVSAAAVWFGFLTAPSAPARVPQPDPAERFTVSDAMIPMRDGARLHTKIFVPKDQPQPLPFIMKRTPYGVERAAGHFGGYFKALADEGYIFVFQDIRGKFGSEGTFVMQRPARRAGDTSALDEGTDTYDTIEWLLNNVKPNAGRVGMLGVSYDGWTTIMGALEPHPALKAISPQASPADMFLGDDFHHNGAFRLSYGFEYAAMMESSKEVQQFAFDRRDTFDWYLRLGPLANANAKYLHEKIPTWNDYVLHPSYDEFWQRQTMIPSIQDVKVPTLNVAGWWDQEDFYGPIRIYDALEQHDARRLNYLVVGPWNHGGWSGGKGDRLGPFAFGSETATYFREQVQAPWFAYFLKDKGRLDLPEALTFEAGSNRWQRWDAWPPRQQTEERRLYFGPDGTISFDKPTAAGSAFDSYISDPLHPVPYRHRPIPPTYFPGGSGWTTWLVEDQRFVAGRPDVLTWETVPLEGNLTIAGEITAHLYAATTGSDADWIVKLIDVYPEDYSDAQPLAGYQLMVSNEVFRGRFRKSFEKPEPITPNAVLEYAFSLHTQDYTFLKGHRLMVQVQSTWFPLIDRNPQTFVANIFQAKAADFRPATHRIYRSAPRASHVAIPVVRGRT